MATRAIQTLALEKLFYRPH